ncbi:MAG: hypothetical protein DRP09_13480 [Candidatus Thorarchaeota archaeon]|nr:MAG: hypothetical protein DRP09_13480 [Candidatus Thorarchaeota archaeon]
MTIFLDYYRGKEEYISYIATKTEDRFRFFRFKNLPGVIEELGGTERIVVYERPYRQLKQVMTGYEHLLEDYRVKKRWTDMFVLLRQETGRALALSRVAESTVGKSMDTRISRLEPAEDDLFRIDLEEKMITRLNALEAIYDYVIKHSQLSYTVRDSTIWAEIIINETVDLED